MLHGLLQRRGCRPEGPGPPAQKPAYLALHALVVVMMMVVVVAVAVAVSVVCHSDGECQDQQHQHAVFHGVCNRTTNVHKSKDFKGRCVLLWRQQQLLRHGRTFRLIADCVGRGMQRGQKSVPKEVKNCRKASRLIIGFVGWLGRNNIVITCCSSKAPGWVVSLLIMQHYISSMPGAVY